MKVIGKSSIFISTTDARCDGAEKRKGRKRMGYSIVVDAMGGDYAPEAPVEGALAALRAFDDLTVTLLGDTAAIEKVLEGKEYNRDRLHILHTTQVVEN